MTSSSRILSIGTALVCVALVTPANAHHSFMSIFDMATTREIEGRITKVLWVNPHVKINV